MLIFEGIKNRGIAFSPLIKKLVDATTTEELCQHIMYIGQMMEDYLLIGGGNIFISGFLCLLKFATWIVTAIMGLFALGSRDGIMGVITVFFAGITAGFSWLWTKFCKLFLMWSMRQNEYVADEYAHRIGFGMELAKVLDQHLCDVPHEGFFNALYNTHPYNDDRVAALQNMGVPYSRY